jgi:hypothetical protein
VTRGERAAGSLVTVDRLLTALAGLVPALTLVVLIVLAAVSGATGTRGAVALAGVSLLWLVVNGPVEGVTLLPIAPGHGVTGADLAGLTGLAIAGWRLHQHGS